MNPSIQNKIKELKESNKTKENNKINDLEVISHRESIKSIITKINSNIQQVENTTIQSRKTIQIKEENLPYNKDVVCFRDNKNLSKELNSSAKKNQDLEKQVEITSFFRLDDINEDKFKYKKFEF